MLLSSRCLSLVHHKHKLSSLFYSEHTRPHTHTHSNIIHRRTSSHAPAPPRSLIYSYLMLWCHNSLSGSLAWQPFVRRYSWGGKRNPAAPFWSFSPPSGWNMLAANPHTHTGNQYVIAPYRLARCCEAVDGVRDIKLMWQLPVPGPAGSHWEVKMLSDTWKWG